MTVDADLNDPLWPPGAGSVLDIVEGWWPDLPTLYAVMSSPEWAAIMSDEANFMDRSKMLMLLHGREGGLAQVSGAPSS